MKQVLNFEKGAPVSRVEVNKSSEQERHDWSRGSLTLMCPKCGRVAMDSVVQVMRNEKGTTRYRVFRHPRLKQKAGVKLTKRCYVKEPNITAQLE